MLCDEIAAALSRGWKLTPMRGKTPTLKGWQEKNDINEVALTTHAKAGGNIGVLTGVSSNIVVLDFDSPLEQHTKTLERLPPTWTVETGGGGLHLFFRYHPGIKNSASKLAPHVDVKSTGGCVLLAGSRHPETQRIYKWQDGHTPADIEIAPLPTWVREILVPRKSDKKPAPTPPPPQNTTDIHPYVVAAIASEVKAVQNAPEGSRNHALNAAAFALAQLSVPDDQITTALLYAAIEAGLSEHEARATIKSGIAGGRQSPRTIPEKPTRPPRPAAVTPPPPARCAQTGIDDPPPVPDTQDAITLRNYKMDTDHDGKPIRIALSLSEIDMERKKIYHDWPRRIENLLFAHAPHDDTIRIIKSPDDLIAWAAQSNNRQWRNSGIDHYGNTYITDGVFYAHLAATTKNYIAAESIPHEPRIPDIYYTWRPPHNYSPDGQHLEQLLRFFDNGETPYDTILIHAMFLTPAWGGLPGTRPAFLITAPDRGYGKTRLSDALGLLYGGIIEIDPGDRQNNNLLNRLLSPRALAQRIVRMDNVRSSLSNGLIEGLITTPTISGHRLYTGEATRPNTLTWTFTANCPRVSRDLAERSIIIRLATPKNNPKWWNHVNAYIVHHKNHILADIIYTLKQKIRSAPPQNDRWASWYENTICRIADDPEPIAALIRERRENADEEKEEIALITEAVESDTSIFWSANNTAFVSSTAITQLINTALHTNMSAKAIRNLLRGHIEAGRLNWRFVHTMGARGYEIRRQSPVNS